MENNYKNTTKKLIGSLFMLMSMIMYSQDIHFTFANAQNTNNGSNDFYEVDVMIQTINSTGSFKLGSGQLYFNYNTTAFGSNISGSNAFEVTYPNAGGYICGQTVDAGGASIYGGFNDNDNTPSLVSWNYDQTFSSVTFAADNVTDTPTLLAHLKIQYVDVLEEPMVTFEDGATFVDQFFTACGSMVNGSGFETADCTGFPGTQLFNDTFDSDGATLSDGIVAVSPLNILIYPNPTSDIINIESMSIIDSVEMFDLLGKQVLTTTKTEQIKINHLPAGVYLLKVYSEKGKLTKKVIIE